VDWGRKVTHNSQAVEFDAATHTYTAGGVVLPSVTTVIRAAGLMNAAYIGAGTTVAMERGSIVAELTELDDMGELDAGSVDPLLFGYLDAWRRFRADAGYAVEADGIERRIANGACAGTLDRVGKLNGIHTIIDIKTGAAAAWHKIQTAGYMMLQRSTDTAAGRKWRRYRRGAVYLPAPTALALLSAPPICRLPRVPCVLPFSAR